MFSLFVVKKMHLFFQLNFRITLTIKSSWDLDWDDLYLIRLFSDNECPHVIAISSLRQVVLFMGIWVRDFMLLGRVYSFLHIRGAILC